MEKPVWRVRSSSYVVESPFMRLRKDEIELPDGSILAEYFVRESEGFVMVFALTPAREVVLTRQYRYGNDRVGLELPAGMREAGEDPLLCAQRELLEETGYQAARWEPLLTAAAEPVRSTATLTAYLAFDARLVASQQLDISEHIEVETAPLDEFAAMLRRGEFESLPCIAVAYAALDRIRA